MNSRIGYRMAVMTIGLTFGLSAVAQEPMKFSAEDKAAPPAEQAPLKFKADDGAAAKPAPKAETSNADFQTYLGYPKSQLGASLSFDNIGSTWKYNGQNFSFRSVTENYGVLYRFYSSPQFNVEALYNHFSLGVSQSTASPYLIEKSTASYDRYGAVVNSCSISSKNFDRQFCFGGGLINEAYPVLKFSNAVDLKMSNVQDLAAEVHASYQTPINSKLVFKALGSFEYGTGFGNSGSLTPKGDSIYGLDGKAIWSVAPRSDLTFDLGFKILNSKLEGQVGANKDSWQTNSSTLSIGFGYLFSF